MCAGNLELWMRGDAGKNKLPFLNLELRVTIIRASIRNMLAD